MIEASPQGSRISAFAAMGPGEALQSYAFEPSQLKPSEIEVAITHCGICHSDLHLIDDAWGVSKYPLVPGHEIVGIVSQVGDAGLRPDRGTKNDRRERHRFERGTENYASVFSRARD